MIMLQEVAGFHFINIFIGSISIILGITLELCNCDEKNANILNSS